MNAVRVFLLIPVLICSGASTTGNGTKILIAGKKIDPVLEYESKLALTADSKFLMQFVLDYATRSLWNEIVLLLPDPSGLLMPYVTNIYQFFNSHGKFIAVHSTSRSLLPQSLTHNTHRVGVVLILDQNIDGFLDELAEMEVFNEYRSWLFIRREYQKDMNLTEKLNSLKLSLNSNAVIGRVERHPAPTRIPQPSTTTEEDESSQYDIGGSVCTPENQKEEWYEGICSGSDLPPRIKRQILTDQQAVITLQQIYKITKSDDSSVVYIKKGFWDSVNRLTNSEELLPVEERLGDHQFNISVGVKNSTFEGNNVPQSSFSMESDEDEEIHMTEVLECLLYQFNASRDVVPYPKFGWRNEEGGWTHMLGGVFEGVLDFALGTLKLDNDPFHEMALTHPIVRTMNNIYFRRPDSGGMRDIFLAPFSPNLIVSVFSTSAVLALAMLFATMAKYTLSNEDGISSSDTSKSYQRKWEMSEAALWGVSIICMQGSPLRPNSKSGSLVLICGLLFALIIYNAYAAFITSVLSVKNSGIKTLEDLTKSNFAFGYTLANADELFLRTVNDSRLRELYFKGLRKNDGVKDPIAGMLRAGKGNYAFFVAARTGRRALKREVPHNQRCGIHELQLSVTQSIAAIPMSQKSTFKKILNFRVIRMMETGILDRFQDLILPEMPTCVERTMFNSASFSDVYSAFYMIVFGWIVSSVVFFMEIIWHRRSIKLAKAMRNPKGRTINMSGSHPRRFR